jgi:tRNA dimethylallyltransferase
VVHHLIDALQPWESASVAWWLEQARASVQDIEGRGKRALFVGGTPLYLKALLRGLFAGPPADLDLRRKLTAEAQRLGSPALHGRLAQIDSVSAERLHPNDLRRIIRALEVWELTGLPISSFQHQWTDVGQRADGANQSRRDAFPRVLWLDLPRTELYARIDARVSQMFAAGLVDEARRLRSLPHPISREALQALGYKQSFEYLDGHASLEQTVERVKTRTRNFAKRQLTWFRHLPECRPVAPELTFAAWHLTIENR